MSTTTTAPTLPRPARRAGRLHLNVSDRVVSAAPLVALLALTAGLYLWGLSKNGTANEYYSAAVQAGTHSWKAFLFGSLDAGNYITVDKPPASLWAMEISTRVFGFGSFSMLLPQALEGVAAVALLFATVRRWFGRPAALLSGLVLAITPVAALMFRFNNPDAHARAAARRRRLLRHPRGRTRADEMVGARRDRARPRVPDEDDAGVHRPAGIRARLPRRRARPAATAGVAADHRRRRDDGGGWLVGRARRAVAGLGPAVHRRLDEQQRARARVRIQRARPDQWRQRPGWGRRGLQRGGRCPAPVQRRARRADQLAAAGVGDRVRVRDRERRPAAAGAHRPPDGDRAVVGRLAHRHGRRVQLHERHDPSVLHEHAGAGHRGADGRGGDTPVAAARAAHRPDDARSDARRDRRVGVCAA